MKCATKYLISSTTLCKLMYYLKSSNLLHIRKMQTKCIDFYMYPLIITRLLITYLLILQFLVPVKYSLKRLIVLYSKHA